jgi:TRAP transporter TAXI family solute receptor
MVYTAVRMHGLPPARSDGSRFTAQLTVVLLLTVALCGCGRSSSSEPDRPVLRVATAFGPFSTRLTEEYRRTLPDVDIHEQQAASSGDVLRAIQSNTLDFGVALADDAYRAYFGEDGTPAPDAQVRGISLLQPLPMYLLVRAGSNIHGVADLKGRVVAVGPKNTSSWKLATLVLQAFAVEPVTVKPLSTREAAAAGLKDGSLDAIVLPGYVYPDEVTRAVIRDGAYLVPIDGPPIEELRRQSPFVRVVMIPRDIYPGQDKIIPTVGIDMMIVCRRDLDEQLAYRLTEQLFNVFPRLARIEATLRFLNLDDAPATPIPLHPGAARYFRERELSR